MIKSVHAVLGGILIGFILALSPSCGPAKEACNASTCPSGCCDAEGVCQPGISFTQCGTSGQACVACAGNQVCLVGTCITSGGTNDGGIIYDAGTGPDGGKSPPDAGTDPDGGMTDPDAGTNPDAGSTADAGTKMDAGTSTCTLPSSFGALGAISGLSYIPSGSGTVFFESDLDGDTNPDILLLELYPGSGVFSGGLKPGTYTLAGDELQYATCGACVRIFGDYVTGVGATEVYMATGGKLTLTSVSGQLTGALSDVTFTHVTINTSTWESTPVGDGCNSAISTATFSEPIQVEP